MAEKMKQPLDAIQKQIFDKIAKNDTDGVKQLVSQLKGVNFVDENGMTPLQHSCCKGNKEIVQVLLDMGADITFNQHGANYTPLHFAALSGNVDVCRLLLDAGIDASCVNSVSRTASQMAAFVGNHSCVETINNYIKRGSLEEYTKPNEQGEKKDTTNIPPELLDVFHSFVIEVNLHPVRIALNLQSLGLLKYLTTLRKTLALMCEREMKSSSDINELMAFKFHYLGWICSELIRCEDQSKGQRKPKSGEGDAAAGKNEYVEMFIKRVLKENKLGQLDYVEFTIRDCAREFPFRDCSVFRHVVTQLADKEALPALNVLRNAINGQRGFVDESSYCSSCGNEKPDKKCSKCKAVQYCDRECQRLHWFMHKKNCSRSSNPTAVAAGAANARGPIDTAELQDEFAKMTAS